MRVAPWMIAAALCVAASPTWAEGPMVGEKLFTQYCASCHGTDAKGGGPMAEYLTVAPADLTTLSAHNDGAFPMLRVIHTIDGRTGVRAHGGPMPVFGDLFMAETDDGVERSYNEALETRGRVLSLATYLEALQQ
ncbi:c-type cytochrome [Pseudothioclava arenosa]|uniref:Cytochrome c domain-containing protein n=1 Tax=Pseudothioclava arenosa TaxID=1795308 RepID=A0A2A4CQL3_9RHOB|nr:c-type cytochrome [Pseudothioclava arenosa]PCD76542.1 hypothetical protein CLN94_08035 [Pseudothioclava arenosa]